MLRIVENAPYSVAPKQLLGEQASIRRAAGWSHPIAPPACRGAAPVICFRGNNGVFWR